MVNDEAVCASSETLTMQGLFSYLIDLNSFANKINVLNAHSPIELCHGSSCHIFLPFVSGPRPHSRGARCRWGAGDVVGCGVKHGEENTWIGLDKEETELTCLGCRGMAVDGDMEDKWLLFLYQCHPSSIGIASILLRIYHRTRNTFFIVYQPLP